MYQADIQETPTAVAGGTLRLNSLVVKSLSLVSDCKNTNKKRHCNNFFIDE